MSKISAKVERMTSGSMRFLFAPQLLSGVWSPKFIWATFVQMLAQFLATANLIPATHRSLRPLSPKDVRMGEVLALAYSNVRAPGARADQWAVFLAVSGLMGLIVLQFCYMSLSLIIGTAHAGGLMSLPFAIPFAAIACSIAGPSSSYFEAPCPTDMAQNWIDVLLLGASYDPTMPAFWFSGQIVSLPLTLGMAAMFKTYSYAMLVLAGFLVMYHLLTVIAGTAHEGRMGGKVMNQVWAPIRLIMAIGMLVPVGTNGLNSGQYITVQAAKWGSGLASNVWFNFATAFGASSGVMNMGKFIIAPPIPEVTPIVEQALNILVCKHVFEDVFAKSLPSTTIAINDSGWHAMTGGATKVRTWDYKEGSNKEVVAICGKMQLANSAYAASGMGVDFLGTSDWYSMAIPARAVLLNAHETAINMMLSGSALNTLATAIAKEADKATTAIVVQDSDVKLFNDAVGDYRTEIKTGLVASIAASGLGSLDMSADAMARGWVSAGVWFNSISRTSGMLMDYISEMPTVEPNFDTSVIGVKDTALRAYSAQKIAYRVIHEDLVPASNALGFALFEPKALVGSATSAGTSTLDMYLRNLAVQFKDVLGTTTNSSDDFTSGMLGAVASFVAPLSLNTANPLAELSAVGNRLIKMALDAAQQLEQCQRVAKMQEMSLYGTKERDSPELSQIRYSGACSYTGTGQLAGASLLINSSIASIISAGVTLAFVLPLLPFIRFTFGILTWIMSMFEAVIAIPVVALAHIKMDGEGLAGPMARNAYMLVLQVFLRPVLMIFGLVLALVLFNVMIVILNEFYAGAARSVESGGNMSSIAMCAYTIIYGLLAYGLANASFKAIDLIPSQCLQWIGASGTQSIDGAHFVQGGMGQAAGALAHGAAGAKTTMLSMASKTLPKV